MKPKALTRKSGTGKKTRVRDKKAKVKSNADDRPLRLTAPKEEVLLHFIEYHPPDGAVEAVDFEDIMHDVEGLFELLDGVGVG